MKAKKAQEEMIGFVLIVVLIVVAGVVFLGFSLRKPIESGKSPELQVFLESSSLITTNCSINFVPQYDSLQDLIKSCHKNKKCLSGEPACEVLEQEFQYLLENSFPVNENTKYKGYKLRIYYSANNTGKTDILNINKSNCSRGYGADKFIDFYPGVITTELEVCFKD